MSRHRDIRNLKIEHELDDEALSDGGEDEVAPEEQEHLDSAFEQVQEFVGEDVVRSLSEKAIKDILWDSYFNVEQTVNWAFEEFQRRNAAKERKGSDSFSFKQLPPIPHGGEEPPSNLEYYDLDQHQPLSEEPLRGIPKIMLAQRQHGCAPSDDSVGEPPARRMLSVITEVTERTEPSSQWLLQHQPESLRTRRSFISSPMTSYGEPLAAKEREKTSKKTSESRSASSSRPGSAMSTQAKSPRKSGTSPKKSGTSTPVRSNTVDQRILDLAGLNITKADDQEKEEFEEPPKMSYAREKLLEEARQAESKSDKKKSVSLVVIGHVDAGKSTLMGRLLYELGKMEEKTRTANERGASKIGKSSFSWAWGLDETVEERERGITMDIALQSLTTTHRQITILDAPGHKDFIPNMISGASQADCALLVVDSSAGEFEAGFDRGGQTREHLLLIRSLGVLQVIVAINKLDQVEWSKDRYDEICNLLRPFLLQTGFQAGKTKFVPVGAIHAVNLVSREGDDAAQLRAWYQGPTLVDLLDNLEPPARDITSPLRLPIANVFKSQQGSGVGVSGRLCAGIVQVGERLRILPGDETAIVKLIEVEDGNVPWAAAGTNITLFLTGVDPMHLSVGSVLCPPTDLVPLVTVFNARIIVFEIQMPITGGASVELFHHSRDVPATISKLISVLDRSTGNVLKSSPRMLTKGMSAEVQISLRTTDPSWTSVRAVPMETFATNKDMGRILIRRGGETVAAGIVMSIEN